MGAVSNAELGAAGLDVVAADAGVVAAVRTAILRLGFAPATRPPAYASPWRTAGLREAAGLASLPERAAANGRAGHGRRTPVAREASEGHPAPGGLRPSETGSD